MKWIRKLFCKSPVFEYGTAGANAAIARRNVKTGVVEFVLWKAGEQGHADDFWRPMSSYWWPTFNKNQETGKQ